MDLVVTAGQPVEATSKVGATDSDTALCGSMQSPPAKQCYGKFPSQKVNFGFPRLCRLLRSHLATRATRDFPAEASCAYFHNQISNGGKRG